MHPLLPRPPDEPSYAPAKKVSNQRIPQICAILGALALAILNHKGRAAGDPLNTLTFNVILGGIGGVLGTLIGMFINALLRSGILRIITFGLVVFGFGGWYVYYAAHPTVVAQGQEQALRRNPSVNLLNSPSNRESVTPASLAASLPVTAIPELAPPGVFYLLTPARVETKDGIIGFPPGTRVTLVRPGIYLTPAGKVSLAETQLTNDIGIARAASANDRNAQANLRASAQAALQAQAQAEAALQAKAQAALRARPVDTIMENGTRKVPAQINGILVKNFVIDSGASSVALPSGVINELMQTGTLTASDFRGTVMATIADGSRSKVRRFLLHSIKVGDTIVSDVEATDDGPNGPLLLGMTFLTKARAIYDTANGRLMFNQ